MLAATRALAVTVPAKRAVIDNGKLHPARNDTPALTDAAALAANRAPPAH